MNIDANVLTFVGFILTWVVFIFGAGVAYGKISARGDKHDKEINEIRTDVGKILASFSTSEGEPRFITYPAHDEMVRRCHEKIDLKIQYINVSTDTLKHDFKALGDSVTSEIKGMSAALQKIVLNQAAHTHRRKTDDQDEATW